jgi:hypothetical protein
MVYNLNKLAKAFVGTVFFQLLTFCSYNFPEPEKVEFLDPGDANFSNIFSVGSYLFSGQIDGVVKKEGQEVSLPALFCKQIQKQDFNQINLFTDKGMNFYSYLFQSSIKGEFVAKYESKKSFYPLIFPVEEGENVSPFQGNLNMVSNFGIAGFKIINLQKKTYDNPYFERLGSFDLIEALENRNHTFFLLSLGLEDVLFYSLNSKVGRIEDDLHIDQIGGFDATPTNIFKINFDKVVDILTKNNSTGVIFNIPDLTELPLFSKVSHLITNYTTTAQRREAELFYTPINQKILEYNNRVNKEEEKRPFIEFSGDAPHRWGVVVYDNTLPDAYGNDGSVIPKIRQLSSQEKLLLYAEKDLGKNGFGTIIPVEEKFYLSKVEVDNIKKRINDYNFIIGSKVKGNPNILLYDLQEFIGKIDEENGIFVNGIPFINDIYQYGIFSLDGFNLNPRGNALLVNEIIKKINSHFKSKIPQNNPNDFRGNRFEFAMGN